MRGGGLTSFVPLLLAGCSAPQALLLPGEDGHPTGALAVLAQDGSEQVMDTPLRSARMGGARASLRTAKTVKPGYQQLLASLPPPARSFTLYFYQGTSSITQASRPLLEDIRAEIAKRPGVEVQVTGHTDSVGGDDENDRLSLQRANEVMVWLIQEGFPREVLSAVGRGERDPVANVGDGVAVPQNRRVEVIVR